MTLACEDAYSKLVEVVTVADVSDKDRVGNSLLQIQIFSTRFGQEFEVEVQAKFLKLKFGQYFSAEAW